MKFTSKFFVFLLLIFALGAGFSSRYFHESVEGISEYVQTAHRQTAFLWGEVERVAKQVAFAEKNQEYKLAFVGDIMLSRGVAAEIRKHNDNAFPFRKIADMTKSYDFMFGNLEGPISERGKNQGSIYSFRARPETVEGLVISGFDAVSIANNHSLDWGTQALMDTIEILQANNIVSVGAGKDAFNANDPVFVEIGNPSTHSGPETPSLKLKKGVRLALFAYTNLYPESFKATNFTPGISNFDEEYIKTRIREVRAQADIVIVSLHWGEEYLERSNVFQQELAHTLINEGADLIVGHHPHVKQEIERYKEGWILYSLGNFVFDQNFSEKTRRGLIAEVLLKDKKIIDLIPREVYINDAFQPQLVEM